MCTWSGIRWPSSIRLSFCAAKRRRTSPRYGRSWPNRAFRRPFGMNTTWYLHSHREWLRLSNSSIVPRPSVCLAAHGSERHDGPPNMSNFCCLPGIAGGLPRFIYQSLYVRGRGALRRELTACLRTGRALRVPRARSRGRGKSHVAPEVMVSQRPAEADDRAVPGHWEGDLILGLRSSAIGTLVERTTRFTILLHLPRMPGRDD